MSSERDIEKTLRDYAKQRQQDAGDAPPLHQATRNLLQGEVTRLRTARRDAQQTWSWLLWGSWPRIAMSLTSVVAVVALAVVFLRDEPFNRQMAQQNAVQGMKELASADAKKETGGAASESGDLALRREPIANSPFPLPSTAPAMALNEIPAMTTPATLPAATAIPATPPALAAAAAESRAALDQSQLTESTRQLTKSATQQFARVIPPAVVTGSEVASNRNDVLSSFRVEQNGEQLRVIDRDGSVYTGAVVHAVDATVSSYLVAAKTATVQEDAEREKQKAEADQARSLEDGRAGTQTAGLAAQVPSRADAPGGRSNAPVQNFFFRVTGTNATLKQPVEFSGSFVANDPPRTPAEVPAFGGGRVSARGGGGGGRGVRNVPAQLDAPVTNAVSVNRVSGEPAEPQLLNFRIQGQATVGSNRVEINAQPTAPR